MWLNLARRSFARDTFREALREEGLAGVWKMVGPMIGRAQDADTARRYNDLGTLADGTFGRAYWDFIVSNKFGFPGEHNAVPERGVWHDMTHVLAGYGTDAEGEVQNVSFIAGYRREDPFFWLFTIALQFHMGLRVFALFTAPNGPFSPRVVSPGAAPRPRAQHRPLGPLGLLAAASGPARGGARTAWRCPREREPHERAQRIAKRVGDAVRRGHRADQHVPLVRELAERVGARERHGGEQ